MKLTSLFCLLSAITFGQSQGNLESSIAQKIDSVYLAKMKDKKVVGASLAIVKGGELVYAQGYGFQDEENAIKANPNTVYRIGSCTKSFTALAIMKLHEEGKLNINDPIQKYIPSIKIKDQQGNQPSLLIKDMLSHQSGLPSDMMNGFFCDNPPSIEWTIDQMNNMVMASPANYVHSYSNLGYGILGKLIADVSGMSYEAYLQKHIFQPLQMNASFVHEKEGGVAAFSKGYVDGKELEEPMIRDVAAGLIHSSVLDMANYLNMFIQRGKYSNGQLLNEYGILAMEDNAVENITLPTSTAWGYGLYSNKMNYHSETDSMNVELIGHGGDTWVYHADFAYIPSLDVGAVILTNTGSGPRMNSARSLLRLYLEEAEGGKLIRDNTVIPSNDKLCSKDDILGQYDLGQGVVNVKNPEKIKFKVNAVTKVVLKPVNDSLRYAGKAKLLGIVPIKIKHQQFRFVEKEDQIYFKVIHMSSGKEDYVSAKSNPVTIPSTWEQQYGKYELVKEAYVCEDCPYMNFEDLTIELSEKDGLIVGELEGSTKDTKRTYKFSPISESVAVSIGVGRGTGNTIRILDNGNLYYNGFELAKTK